LEILTLETIAQFAKGALRQGEPGALISGIGTDSRTLGAGELFLALRGEKFDGHDFVAELTGSGAAGAIVADDFQPPKLSADFALISVDDTLLGYHRIAAAYRATLPLKVIAITGSNGKTSTKDLTAAILTRQYRVLKTEGNFNNHIGVPRMLLRASRADQIAVLEMGMNHPGELAPLARMARPDIGIITNIGCAHIEFMKTRDAIALEKGMVAESVGPGGCVILPAEDEYTDSIARRAQARVVLAGFGSGSVRGKDFIQGFAGSHFGIAAGGESVDVFMPVLGRHMAANALLAVAAGLECGMPLAECAAGLAQARLTKGRLEPKTARGLRFLDDTYNANPDSMVAALETLASIRIEGRRIAVLGRMGELGAAADAGYQRVGETAARLSIDRLICVGPETELMARAALEAGLREVALVPDVAAAARLLDDGAQKDDLILLKGSRSAAMERILSLGTSAGTPSADRKVSLEPLAASHTP
jgi:UDP-N-acetylmuramoyl-tripeptide--D-alanyl-D-alanine ligase